VTALKVGRATSKTANYRGVSINASSPGKHCLRIQASEVTGPGIVGDLAGPGEDTSSVNKNGDPKAAVLSSMKLVPMSAPKHGTYLHHMRPGVVKNIGFRIVIDAVDIAVIRIDRDLTNLINQFIHASRQLLVITTHAAILFRIAGQCAGRHKRPSKENPLNQGGE